MPSKTNNILFISDLHIPYHHEDAFAFLKALHKKYKFSKIMNVGDVIDHHTASFHDVEYGTLSPKEEHDRQTKYVQELHKMFPKMIITLGNHDNIPKRKLKTVGMSPELLKDYNELYGTKGWVWTDKEYFKINRTEDCMMTHTMSSNTLNNAMKHSFNTVQGHHHSKFGVEYFTDAMKIKWSMTVGCLIDPNNEAFKYNASTTGRPIIGCGAVIDGRPVVIAMHLKRNGRWDSKV